VVLFGFAEAPELSEHLDAACPDSGSFRGMRFQLRWRMARAGPRQGPGQAGRLREHLHQIGLALRLYADENEGLLPTTTHDGATNASWIHQFSDYVGNVDRIRLCPADPKAEQRVAAKAASHTQNEYTSVDLTDPRACWPTGWPSTIRKNLPPWPWTVKPSKARGKKTAGPCIC
jgi:hypothetical protein